MRGVGLCNVDPTVGGGRVDRASVGRQSRPARTKRRAVERHRVTRDRNAGIGRYRTGRRQQNVMSGCRRDSEGARVADAEPFGRGAVQRVDVGREARPCRTTAHAVGSDVQRVGRDAAPARYVTSSSCNRGVATLGVDCSVEQHIARAGRQRHAGSRNRIDRQLT